MIPYLVAGVIGAYLANRRAPASKVNKLKCIGPVTGLTYEVEELPEADSIIVRINRTCVSLRKTKDGYRLLKATGDTTDIQSIRQDFGSRVK
jgi:hypothetical protein